MGRDKYLELGVKNGMKATHNWRAGLKGEKLAVFASP